jgi:bleomycin hydrolase
MMTPSRCIAVLLAASLLLPAALAAQTAPPRDKASYVKHVEDPVLKDMMDQDKKSAEEAQAATKKIADEQQAAAKKEEESKPELRLDLKGLAKPSGVEAFKVHGWYFPPVPQYLTGTCWSFSTTSFYESEIKRLTGQEIKLSEMWTAYCEYLEKAKRYIATRGHSVFEEGSEAEAIPRVWEIYGVVPEEAYPGVCAKDGRHDHVAMAKEMQSYLAYCKANNLWDEGQILDALKDIMKRTMGAPPAEVKWQGKTYTPQAFLSDVCKLKMDDYVCFMSTTAQPFWQKGELKVEDNWWKGTDYYNVPLDVWYDTLLKAVKAGSTAAIGGDVSEPGYYGAQKVAIIPTFDIPQAYIDQDAREFRLDNGSTTDDHGVHLVGWTSVGGEDWFLIKDSARAARKAPPEGYLFYRADYVKLKMMTYTVHKDFAKDVLAKFEKAGTGK